MLALSGARIRRTADAVVHRRPVGRDPEKSAAARVGGFARAQHLPPERRREIGKLSNVAGLRALAPIHAAANRRMEGHIEELARVIKEAAAIGRAFNVEAFIADQDWPNESGLRTRFKAKHGVTPRAFYQQHFVELGSR